MTQVIPPRVPLGSVGEGRRLQRQEQAGGGGRWFRMGSLRGRDCTLESPGNLTKKKNKTHTPLSGLHPPKKVFN